MTKRAEGPFELTAAMLRTVVTSYALCLPIVAALLVVALAGCERQAGTRPSSSAAQARERGLFVTGYAVPTEAKLGDYRLVETWIERDPASGEHRLVVRMQGPYVDREPR